MTFEERLPTSGKVQTGYILLWSFSDPINPQYVLEAPGDDLTGGQTLQYFQ